MFFESRKDNKFSYLPRNWVWTRLGEICLELVGGGTPSREIPEYFGGNIVWLTPTEIPKEKIVIINESKEKITERGLRNSSAGIIPKNSVLLTSRASIGYVAIAGCDLTTNQGFASFVCSDAIFNFYLAYWLWANKDMLEANATGTTFKEIAKSKIREFYFPLPPLPEQHRIVAKIEELFTRLDAGVDAIKKVKAEIKRYRQAVLKYAFEGKLTEEWRESSLLSLRGDKTTEALVVAKDKVEICRGEVSSPNFICQNKDKGGETPPLQKDLPQLPEGWVWMRMGEVAMIIMGQSPPSNTYNKERLGLPFYQGKAEFGEIYPSPVKWCNKPLKIAEKNDILLSVRAPVGPTNICYETCCIGRGLVAIRYKFKDVYKFVFYYLRNIENELSLTGTGSTFSAISKSQIENLEIPLPPLSEQHKIVSEIERRFSVADEVEKVIDNSLKQAQRLRQSILKRAFEGRLVPQDPADELLERIRQDRTQRASDKGVKEKIKGKFPLQRQG